MYQKIKLLLEIKKEIFETLHLSKINGQLYRTLFNDLIKIFSKLSTKLNVVISTIEQEILPQQFIKESYLSFVELLNSLQHIENCSRKLSSKIKSEVYEPLKITTIKCEHTNAEIYQNVENKFTEIETIEKTIEKEKQAFYGYCARLEKYQLSHEKNLLKKESLNQKELERYNKDLNQLKESIKNQENIYQSNLVEYNNAWKLASDELEKINDIMISTKRIGTDILCLSLIKIVPLLNILHVQKTENTSIWPFKENHNSNTINDKISLLVEASIREEFIPYENFVQSKENEHLIHLLEDGCKEIKQFEKLGIELLARNLLNKKKGKNVLFESLIDKLLSLQNYSFYFVECCYREKETNSEIFLQPEIFFFYQNFFSLLLRRLSPSLPLHIDILHKILYLSSMIFLRKFYSLSKTLKNELAGHINEQNLKLLYQYIYEKRFGKKKEHFFTSLKRGLFGQSKEEKINDEDNYLCLKDLMHLLCDISVSNIILLPFLKTTLGDNEYYMELKKEILETNNTEERERQHLNSERRSRKEEKWRKALTNEQVASYCIAIVVKHGFIGEEWNLRLVCKSLSNVHKHIISGSNCSLEKKWVHLMGVVKNNYIQMKQEVAEESKPSAVEEIISLDVHRTLHLHGGLLNPTLLHSLLRTYAYYHNEVSYCQGMNYIAGYLFIKMREEERTYFMFEWAMEKYFKHNFADEFIQVKQRIYQFERILCIFNPTLSKHFQKENITAECYIVSWIITLFTSAYQNTFCSHVVDSLWDRFLTFGWREFFRFLLWLFEIEQKKLLSMPYDGVLHYLAEIYKSPLFIASPAEFLTQFPHIEQPKEGMKKYYVTDELLLKYELEYNLDH